MSDMEKEDIDEIEDRGDIDREILPEEKKLSEDLKKAYANFMRFMEDIQTDYENRLRIYSEDEPDVVRLGKVIEYNKKRLDEIEKAISKNLGKQIDEQFMRISALEQNQMTEQEQQRLMKAGELRAWDLYNQSMYHEMRAWRDEVKRNFGLLGNKKPVVIIFKEGKDGKITPVRGDDDLIHEP